MTRLTPWLVALLALNALIALVGGCLIALALASTAHAHDFYSQYCCSGKDCGPAASGDVQWTPAGYAVQSTQEIVPFDDKRIQYSPPGEPGFRICIPPGQMKLRCLYVPEPEG